MTARPDLADAILGGLEDEQSRDGLPVRDLPSDVWSMPRRTERMIAGHVRNIRCMWIKMLGKPHGIRARWQWSKRAKEAAARRR